MANKVLIADLSKPSAADKIEKYARLIERMSRVVKPTDKSIYKWGVLNHPTENKKAMIYLDDVALPIDSALNDQSREDYNDLKLDLQDLSGMNSNQANQFLAQSSFLFPDVFPAQLEQGLTLDDYSNLEALGFFSAPI